MACVLNQDPEKFADALAERGAAPVIAVTSAASTDVMIIAARLLREELTVKDGRVALPPLDRGVNVLFLTIEGVSEGAEVRIVEHCPGSGEPCVVTTKRIRRTGFGAEPALRFEINVP